MKLIGYATTGSTCYAVLLNANGQAWNGAAFEALNPANWTTYDIAMTEGAGGIYTASVPVIAAGAYSYVVYSQAGTAVATTDRQRGAGYFQWDGTAEVLAAQAGDAMALTAAAVDAILDEGVEGTYTLRQAQRLMTAVLAGKTSGGGSATFTIRDISDSKARVTATLDGNGNRTAVTLDAE